MKHIVRNLIVLGCVGSSAWAAPFLAIGDNAELFLTGSAGIRYDDNILLAPSGPNKMSDGILQFVPGIELDFGKDSAIKGMFTASETLSQYLDHDEFNTQLASVAFKANYDNEKTSVATYGSYHQLDQNTYAANGTSVRRDVSTLGVNGEYAVSQKTSFGAGFSFSRTEYLQNGYTGEKDYSVPLNAYYAITPKVDLSAGLTYTRSDVDNGLSYDDYYYNIGARGEFTPKLTGNFSIGFDDRSASGSPTAQDNSGLSFHGGLSYLYSPKTTFTFNADKGFTNSAASGSTQKNLSFSLGGQTQIAPDWKANAGITYRQIEYQGLARTDDYVEGTIGATYIINANFSVNGSYIYRENTSDAASAEFKNNVVALSVSARY